MTKIPVIVGTILSTALKLPLKFTKDASAPVVATLQTASQVVQALLSLQFVGWMLFPVIPWGAAVDMAFTLIEALMNYPAVIIAKIRKTLMTQYSILFSSVVAKRKAALNKLYVDLKAAQLILIIQLRKDTANLLKMKIRYPKIDLEYQTQMALYQATIAEYALNAKNAESIGDTDIMNKWIQAISDLDPWLASIILKLTEKITLTIDMLFLQMTIDEETPPTLISIEKIWDKMAWEWSFIFNVAVPYYPDIPDPPNLPPMPPKWKIPQIVKCIIKGSAKWLSTPQLPPLGVIIDATLHCIMNLLPVQIPPLASLIESTSDSIINYLGFCI